jgi:hypothetical protein
MFISLIEFFQRDECLQVSAGVCKKSDETRVLMNEVNDTIWLHEQFANMIGFVKFHNPLTNCREIRKPPSCLDQSLTEFLGRGDRCLT